MFRKRERLVADSNWGGQGAAVGMLDSDGQDVNQIGRQAPLERRQRSLGGRNALPRLRNNSFLLELIAACSSLPDQPETREHIHGKEDCSTPFIKPFGKDRPFPVADRG